MSQTKVLVVDDEKDIAHAISMRLSFAGYRVVTAGNGKEAVHLALHMLPDLVILDIGLPDENGHAVAQHLFTMTETIAIPIIFLSARTADEDRAQAYKLGAVAYLTKPFQSQELLDAVSRAETASRQMHSTSCLHQRIALRS